MPFKPLRNPFPPMKVISADQVEAIHHASLRILSEIGMAVQHGESRYILAQAGAYVDESTQMVRFDPALVESLITDLPSQFTAIARDRSKSTVVGADNINFSTVAGPAFINDLDRGRRPGTYADMCDIIRLTHSLNIIHHDGGAGLEPLDLPEQSRHLDMMYAQATLTDKNWHPCWQNGTRRAEDTLEMTAISLGMTRAQLAENPTVYGSTNTNSPLQLDAAMAEGLLVMARGNQPLEVTPFCMAGAMSPATVAGSLAQQNAEILGCFVLVQAARRGCPVVYGHFTTNVDMKTGSPAFGTPEYAQSAVASAQMARRYGVPCRSNNATGSSVVDAQAAYEGEMSIWSTVMSHTNMILHGTGWLEGGLSASLEKIILDAEMLQLMAAYLAPLEVSDSTLALEAIAEVGPGGHFFAAADTLERYESAFYTPLISDWRNFEAWHEDGAKTATQRANGVWKQLLRDYEQPPLDPAIDEALKDYMARRKEEISRTGE